MNASATHWLRRIWRHVAVFDPWLLLLLLALAAVGLSTMYSAVGHTDGRFAEQVRNFGMAFAALWIVAQFSPQWLMRSAVLFYLVGLLLLLGVEFFGDTRLGATRWLEIGPISIQPSEIMKIAMPLMLAWYFHRREGKLRVRDFLVGGVLLGLPFWLIVRQPDLGTALLVFGAGFFVIYFAGLSFKLLLPATLAGVALIGSVLFYEDTLCAPEFDWVVLHDYQKHRVCTLLDPTTDPLGKGFHTIQSSIAIGSGGIFGKGYRQGTQAQLDFVPERTTDFIFAVFAEEHGLVGSMLLLLLYFLIILRGLSIAFMATTPFARMLAGALTMMVFVYVFVNIGMVTGILPIVGVPLPWLSYGGTALLTLGIAFGILMGLQRHREPHV